METSRQNREGKGFVASRTMTPLALGLTAFQALWSISAART